MAVLCLNFKAMAQAPLKEIMPLRIGQKIPTGILNQKFPMLGTTKREVDSLSLASFSGKLILLDFWATWCSNCIYKFEQLEQLQLKYADRFKVVLVNAKNTKDTAQRMKDMLSGKKAPFVRSNLVTVFNDTTFNQLFPHNYLPHYVWIGGKGEVLAFTNAAFLNEELIQHLLGDKDKQKVQAELTKKP